MRPTKECPNCHCTNRSVVADSRGDRGFRRRTYVCKKCEARWNTIEIDEDEYIALMDKEQDKEWVNDCIEVIIRELLAIKQ